MKEIKAFVKQHKLNELLRHLKNELKCLSISISQNHIPEEIAEEIEELQDYVKIEIICKPSDVSEIVDDIKMFARTGLKNDGRIFISSIGKTIDISD